MVGFGLGTALFDVGQCRGQPHRAGDRLEADEQRARCSSFGQHVGCAGCAGLLRLGVYRNGSWQASGLRRCCWFYRRRPISSDGPPDAHADENNVPSPTRQGRRWMGMVPGAGLAAEGWRAVRLGALYVSRSCRARPPWARWLPGLQRRHGLWPAGMASSAARPRGAAAAPAAREWRSRGGGSGHCAGGRPEAALVGL